MRGRRRRSPVPGEVARLSPLVAFRYPMSKELPWPRRREAHRPSLGLARRRPDRDRRRPLRRGAQPDRGARPVARPAAGPPAVVRLPRAARGREHGCALVPAADHAADDTLVRQRELATRRKRRRKGPSRWERGRKRRTGEHAGPRRTAWGCRGDRDGQHGPADHRDAARAADPDRARSDPPAASGPSAAAGTGGLPGDGRPADPARLRAAQVGPIRPRGRPGSGPCAAPRTPKHLGISQWPPR